MHTIITEPENTARHAREHQVLLSWFQRRPRELGIDQMTDGDPMDPHYPSSVLHVIVFDIFIDCAECPCS